jgi:hypothetical protein
VLLAFALIAILAIAALVLDGGQLYNQRRDTQNAADAAAMAGTRALDRVKFSSGTGALPTTCANPAGHTIVFNTVSCLAVQNNTAVASCKFIDYGLNVLGDCDSAAVQSTSGAQGVQVTTSQSKPTNFAPAAGGAESTTATVTAAALLQPVVSGNGPWAVCATGVTYDFFTNGVLDPTKLQLKGAFAIQGAQIYKDDAECSTGGAGGAGSFKGKIDTSSPMVVGQASVTPDVPGNGGADTTGFYVACPDGVGTNCMLLPIADHTNGNGANSLVYVKAWAYFRIDESGSCPGQGSVKACATYAGMFQSGSAPEGTGAGYGVVTAGQARFVRLVQ